MKLFLLTAFFIGFFGFAQAAEPVRLTYAVYGGGLHIVNAGLQLNETPSRYDARIQAGTQGFLGNIAPWKADIRSTGLTESGGWVPQNHDFTTIWRDKFKTYRMRYDAKGRIIDRVVVEQDKPDDTKPADATLAAGATDLPTGILNFLRHRNLEQGCEGRFTVYDGKRRFEAILSNARDETVPRSRYSVFSGPAISCTVEIKQDGGEWSSTNRGWFKLQEDSRARGRLPRITIAELPGVAGWLVPVRLDLASPWGAFVMHLTGVNGPVK